MKRARDIMSEAVISVTPDCPLLEALEILVESRITGMPVVDSDGTIRGVVSEADGLKAISRGLDIQYATVEDVMTKEVIAVEEDASLEEVTRLLTSSGIRRVPVLRNGNVVGLISRRDLVMSLEPSLQGHTSRCNAE